VCLDTTHTHTHTHTHTQVFVPCGHKAFCKRCAKGLKECPLCKSKVSRVQTIFHV